MDTTEQYIKMCKAAPEIQKMRKKEFGDFVYAPQYGEIYTIFDGADNEYHISSHHYHHVTSISINAPGYHAKTNFKTYLKAKQSKA